MVTGNGKPLHEVMAQMLTEDVVGKQGTSISVDKDIKDPNKESIDTANIIKSAPTRPDPNKVKDEIEDKDKDKMVDEIADGVLVVADPEMTNADFEEVADELQGIVDNADGELPFTDKYIGQYVLGCPICGGTFVSETLLDNGEDACPICCKVPDAFVVNGRIEDDKSVLNQDKMQDAIDHDENLDAEEPEESLEEPMEDNIPEEPNEEEEENPMRKESKEINGNVVTENKKIEEGEYEDYMEQEKALAKEYEERVLKTAPEEAKISFNSLKELLDGDSHLEEIDGFYFPEDAVNVLRNTDKTYHLNSNMDLTIVDVLNLVEDSDTIEEAVGFLFKEYKADSAYSWADNFVTVLSKLDFDISDEEDYDDLEESKKITEASDRGADIKERIDKVKGFKKEVSAVKASTDDAEEVLEDIVDRVLSSVEDIKDTNWAAEDLYSYVSEVLDDVDAQEYGHNTYINSVKSNLKDALDDFINNYKDAVADEELEENKKLTEGNIFADASNQVSNLIDRACNELEGEDLQDFLQGLVDEVKSIADDKGVYVESKKAEGREKKQEYIENNSADVLNKHEFKDVDELDNYVENEEGYEINSRSDEWLEIFDPRESDGNVYAYKIKELADGSIEIVYDAKESYNMNESKKITESKGKDFKGEIENAINSALVNVYKSNGVKTGDISPEQSLELDEIVDKLNTLFNDLCEQNSTGELDEGNKIIENKLEEKLSINSISSRLKSAADEMKAINQDIDDISREGSFDKTEFEKVKDASINSQNIASDIDKLYNKVNGIKEMKGKKTEGKLVESTVVWTTESNDADEDSEDFKSWLEDCGYQAEIDEEEDEDTKRAMISDYLEMFNENDAEALIEDLNDNILPMIEEQLNSDDLLILLGTTERWNGSRNGGAVCEGVDDFRDDYLGYKDYDTVRFKVDDNNNVSVDMIHHDGTDSMELYTFNGDYEGVRNKLVDLGENEFDEDAEDSEYMYNDTEVVDFMMDNGYQEELREFLVPIKWQI